MTAELQLIIRPRLTGRTTELCELALRNSSPDMPALIISHTNDSLRYIERTLARLMPEEPEYHDAVVDVMHISQLPIGLTGKRYGFFGIDNYDYLSIKDRARIRPDFVDAKLIVQVWEKADELMAEIPDYDTWDAKRWPEGPPLDDYRQGRIGPGRP